MGDAHTDIARSDDWYKAREIYFERLAKYFIEESEENYTSLEEVVIHRVSEGHLKSDVVVSEYLSEQIEKLKNNDEGVWIDLLENPIEEGLYKKLLEKSPFAGREFIGYRMLSGAVVPCNVTAHYLERLIREKMKKEEYDFSVFNGDRFSLAVSKELLERIVDEGVIVWKGSNYSRDHPKERD